MPHGNSGELFGSDRNLRAVRFSTGHEIARRKVELGSASVVALHR